ncbi:hypothetical protein N402_03580 [Helicobacter pylori FD423]|nr:hypothetical protein N402_03580 [Helicobacter pylori FD423]
MGIPFCRFIAHFKAILALLSCFFKKIVYYTLNIQN